MPVSKEALRWGTEAMRMELKNPPEFTKERSALWAEAFKDLDDADFRALCTKAVIELEWFPNIGALRKLGGYIDDGSKLEARATVAWEACRAAIRRYGMHASLRAEDVGGDPVALWALARLTTERLGMMTQDQTTFVFSEYRKLYAAGVASGQETFYLGGTYEALNGTIGLDPAARPMLAGRPDLRILTEADLLPLPAPGELLREEDRGKGTGLLRRAFGEVSVE